MAEIAFNDKRTHDACVIGENCNDVYKYVRPKKISPEGPHMAVKVLEEVHFPGMAGNVFNTIEGLSRLHKDSENLFISNSVVRPFVRTRYVDKKSGVHLLRTDEDPAVTSLADRYTDKFFREVEEILDCTEYLILSDYNKGLIDDNSLWYLVGRAVERHTNVYVDSRRNNVLELLSTIQELDDFGKHVFVKLNEEEYSSQTQDLKKVNLIVTLGKKGCKVRLHSQDKFNYINSKFAVVPQDINGAGDTFLACFAYFRERLALSGSRMIENCLALALLGASLGVQKEGTSSVNVEDFKKYFREIE